MVYRRTRLKQLARRIHKYDTDRRRSDIYPHNQHIVCPPTANARALLSGNQVFAADLFRYLHDCFHDLCLLVHTSVHCRLNIVKIEDMRRDSF